MDPCNSKNKRRTVELFAGAGGLAIGVEQAGFRHCAVVEFDEWACKTLTRNRSWPIHQQDIRSFNYSSWEQQIDLLAGGPPCQPFSFGGKHKAHNDSRNMFPEAIRAVRELQPKAFLFENVGGLYRKTFSNYLEYIVLQLKHPEISLKANAEWTNHFAKLQQHETLGAKDGLHYKVLYKLIDASDHGIPQRRERLFIVGFRSDLGVQWSFPSPTHSHEALLWAQFNTGEYWEQHRLPKKTKEILPYEMSKKAACLKFQPPLKPWRTVRDAFKGLPDPMLQTKRSQLINGHQFIDGARSYKGHTGSIYDLPSKTLKAGVHGVPGGENMLLLPSGNVRYFTVRECARLQCFPDDFVFEGTWVQVVKQLGNAVPVDLAAMVAKSIFKVLQQTAP